MKLRNPVLDEEPGYWAQGVLAVPSLPFWQKKRPWKQAQFSTPFGAAMLVLKRDYGSYVGHGKEDWDEVLWFVRLGRTIAAAGRGWAFADDRMFAMRESAVREEFRRKGLYQATIKAIRKLFGARIESDYTQSTGAKKAWTRAGAVSAKRLGFSVKRINPAARRNPAPDSSVWTEMIEMDMRAGRVWTLIWVNGVHASVAAARGASAGAQPGSKARAYILFREVTGKYTTTWFCHDRTARATETGWLVGAPRRMPHLECLYVDEQNRIDDEDLRKLGMDSYFMMQRMVARIKELDAT